MLYLDSSALAKHYFKERGSRQLSALLQKQSVNALFTSVLTYAEIHAIIARCFREKLFTQKDFVQVRARFEADWLYSLSHIALNAGVLGFLQDILAKHPLRGADAVHLASALWLRDATRLDNSKGNRSTQSLTFACSDIQLNRAAAASGLTVFNPET